MDLFLFILTERDSKSMNSQPQRTGLAWLCPGSAAPAAAPWDGPLAASLQQNVRTLVSGVA